MDCCNEYGHCTGGHNCPARATPLVDASRKALAVLSLTGADPALQDELVGAMAEPDRRVAEMTAQLEAGKAVWRQDQARIAELTAQRDALQARLDVLLSEEKSMVEKTGYLSADVLADNYLLVVRESKSERDELLAALIASRPFVNAWPQCRDSLTPEIAGSGLLKMIDAALAKHQPTAAPAANTP